MSQYRKKPVVIEAVQWRGNNYDEIFTFCTGGKASTHSDGTLRIYTLEGEMIGSKGDWIIKGVKGEFYPCKPDIFEQSYELV